MNWPIIYDKFEERYEGYGLAILENAKDVRVYEKLNGEHTLEFVLPRNDPKWEYIEAENFIKVDGHIYIIRATEEHRDSNGRLLSNIQCEHIFTELLDEYIQHEEHINVTAPFALDRFLNGTRFSPDATRLTGNRDLEVEDGTPVTGINLMLEEWKAEVRYDGMPGQDGKFRVTLLPERGENRGVQIRYRKNLKSIKKTTNSRSVVTRLYVYGKDGLGIEGASQNKSGLSYIDSPHISMYRHPKKGHITFNDIEDPDELYEAGLKHLATVDTPQLTYEVDMLELENELKELGDTVRTIDEELGIDVYARIVEYEHYPFEPWRGKVVLANFRPGLTDFLSELQDAKDTVQKITNSRGKVNASYLEGIISTLKTRITGSMAMANAEVMEDKGILFENTDVNSQDYGALYIGPGIFAIADKKSGDKWDWRAFGTGAGFTADEIVAGVLNAALVKIQSGNSVYIDGTGIHVIDPEGKERLRIGEYRQGKYGAKFTDGEVYSSRFQTGTEGADTYIALEPPSFLVCYKNGKRIIRIDASAAYPVIDFFDYKTGKRLGSVGEYEVNSINYLSVTAPNDSNGIYLSAGGNNILMPTYGSMKLEVSGELQIKGDVYVTGRISSGVS
ncbi:phage tail spike protein [Aneurinibacillus migulanus]|uniref:phage tail spike protein n=1 Tax=Aneurinibacillus migulanus TaxID=47500 RepID=UPI00209DD2F6|nr:phage tail protein [Aneurinibacillus migulanus]